MPKGTPATTPTLGLAAEIEKSISELNERLRIMRVRERQIIDLQAFIDSRPLLTKADVLKVGRALPTVREIPDDYRPAHGRKGKSGGRQLPKMGKAEAKAMAKTLREAREKAGLSKPELAEKIGVGQASIYAWENGTYRPTGDAPARLAAVLKLPANWLNGATAH